MEALEDFKDKTIAVFTKEKTLVKEYTATIGGWVALACSFCATVLFVVGFATVGWGHVRTENHPGDIFYRNLGLWQECHNILGCSALEVTAALQAAQAFAVMSMILLLSIVILHCIYVFDPTYNGHPLIALSVFILLPTSVVFLLILICVYGDKWTVPRFVSPQHSTRLTYSFGLAVTAFLLVTGASFFMMFEVLARAEQVRKGVLFVKTKLTRKGGEAGTAAREGEPDRSPPPAIAHSIEMFGEPMAAEKLKRMSFQGYALDEGFEDPFQGSEDQWLEVGAAGVGGQLEMQPPQPPVDYSKRERQRGRRHQGHTSEPHAAEQKPPETAGAPTAASNQPQARFRPDQSRPDATGDQSRLGETPGASKPSDPRQSNQLTANPRAQIMEGTSRREAAAAPPHERQYNQNTPPDLTYNNGGGQRHPGKMYDYDGGQEGQENSGSAGRYQRPSRQQPAPEAAQHGRQPAAVHYSVGHTPAAHHISGQPGGGGDRGSVPGYRSSVAGGAVRNDGNPSPAGRDGVKHSPRDAPPPPPSARPHGPHSQRYATDAPENYRQAEQSPARVGTINQAIVNPPYRFSENSREGAASMHRYNHRQSALPSETEI